MACVGVLGWTCLKILSPFLGAMAWAGLLAFLSWPLFAWVKGRFPAGWGEDTRGAWAAGLMTGLAVLALALPLWWVTASSLSALGRVAERLEGWWAEGLPGLVEAMKGHPVFSPVAERARTLLGQVPGDRAQWAKWGLAAGRQGVEWLVRGGMGVGSALFQMAFGLVFLFGFYMRGPVMAAWAGEALEGVLGPIQGRLRARTETTLRTVVRGAIGTAILQALVAGAGYWWLDAPSAGWLAVATFVLALLPMGPALVWGPLAVWFFLTGEVRSGVWMVLWGVVAVGSVDNVARPFLTSGGAGEGWTSLREGIRRHVARWGAREAVWGVVTGGAVGLGFAWAGLPWWPGVAAGALSLWPRGRHAGLLAFLCGMAWAAATGRYGGALWMAVFVALWLPLDVAGRRWVRRGGENRCQKGRGQKRGKRKNDARRAMADSPLPKGPGTELDGGVRRPEGGGGGRVSFLLMLTGLTGGAMAFGFIGLFLGPVALALGCDVVAALAEGGEERGASK